MKKMLTFWLGLLFFSFTASAEESCAVQFRALAENAAISAEEVFQKYPKLRDNADKMNAAILEKNYPGKVSTIEEIFSRGIRNYNGGDGGELAKLKALPEDLQRTIIAVYNRLLDKQAMAAYTQTLLTDTAVEMAKRPQARTRAITNFPAVNGEIIPKQYTNKEAFLLEGITDRASILKVLVHRIHDRGEEIAFILPNSKGQFSGNNTKNMKFENFYQVPGRGPFIDAGFGRHSSHGQDIHLMQMDYVADVIAEETGGNPRLFWDYATKKGTGDWIWDTMFDGMNSTYMHPEHIGPLLRNHLPLH